MSAISSSANLGSSATLGASNPYKDGQRMMARDSHLASSVWGFDASTFTKTPKHKFLYYVKFIRGTSSSSSSTSNIISATTGSTSTDWSTGVGFLAKKVTRPNVEFDTEILNQYNKKRVIQTGHSIGKMSINFHDTVDNQVMKMFQEYYQFYYADPQNTTTSAWINDITNGNFQTGVNDWGFKLNSNAATNTYFFDRIELYMVFAGQYSQVNFANPKISSFEPDELSFSEGGETCEIEMNLEFEGMVYVANNQSISSNSGLVSDLRLVDASYYQPPKDTNADLSLALGEDLGLYYAGSTSVSDEFGTSDISGPARMTTSITDLSSFDEQLSKVSGLTGAYATEDSYTKLFNTVNQARLDTMISHNYGDLAANLGFDFFNTGTASNLYFQVSNPVLRNSILGDFL